jgi:hypothetical protein
LVAEVISDININLAMVEDGQAFANRQYLSGWQRAGQSRPSRGVAGAGRQHHALGLPSWMPLSGHLRLHNIGRQGA